MAIRKNNLFYQRERVLLVCIFCFSFLVYAFLAFVHPQRYSSPDEAANYFFAKQWSESLDPRLQIPFEVVRSDFLHPRSMISVGGLISPISFIGFPLFAGMVARIFTPASIPFVTPVLAALGIVCFYALLHRLHSRFFALAGAALLAFHPAYWYNATRSLFHNSGFVALLLAAAYLLVAAAQQKEKKYFILGGLALGFATSFRTSEIIWMFLAALVLFLFYWKVFFQRGWLLTGGMFLLVLVPIFSFNTVFFGHPLQFGYGAAESVAVGVGTEKPSNDVLATLFPFGVHLERSILIAWQYLGKFFFWFTPFILVGVIVFLASVIQKTTHERKIAFLVPWSWIALVSSLWLIVLYGSWDFWEYQGQQELILGSSYLRYWLPIYVLTIPYCILGLQWFTERIAALRSRGFVLGIVLMIFFSWGMVYDAPLYGLTTVHNELTQSDEMFAKMRAVLPADAVVISGKADKVLFPTYFVIAETNFSDREHQKFIRDLFAKRPVYLLINAIDQEKTAALNEALRYGFLFTPQTVVSSYQDLFKLENVSEL